MQTPVARVLQTGGRVLYIDHESDPGEVVARFLALGADPASIRAQFVYLQPNESSILVWNAQVPD